MQNMNVKKKRFYEYAKVFDAMKITHRWKQTQQNKEGKKISEPFVHRRLHARQTGTVKYRILLQRLTNMQGIQDAQLRIGR